MCMKCLLLEHPGSFKPPVVSHFSDKEQLTADSNFQIRYIGHGFATPCANHPPAFSAFTDSTTLYRTVRITKPIAHIASVIMISGMVGTYSLT